MGVDGGTSPVVDIVVPMLKVGFDLLKYFVDDEPGSAFFDVNGVSVRLYNAMRVLRS